MSDERTKDLNGQKSFEERVFARFDRMDLRLEKLEARSYDTKPIWEEALKAIKDTGKEVGAIKVDIGEVKNRVTVIESAIAGLATDVGTLKTNVGDLKTGYAGIKDELVDIRREVRENIRQELSQILKFLLEDRSDIRDAEDRIRKLETRLA
jgi:chromosome segregation ATPase